MTQVAGISTQGITSFWAQKKIRKSSEDVSHSPNFIGLLIAFTSFIVVLIFLLMYARKCIRCSLIKEHSNTMPLKATNSSAINGISNDMIEVEETSINSKFTHLMVPNSSERKISIRNSPLPPIPNTLPISQEKFERQDSKNSLVSDDDDYLMPRDPLRLQNFEMEDDYSKPSFNSHMFCNNVSLENGKTRNLIPMISY